MWFDHEAYFKPTGRYGTSLPRLPWMSSLTAYSDAKVLPGPLTRRGWWISMWSLRNSWQNQGTLSCQMGKYFKQRGRREQRDKHHLDGLTFESGDCFCQRCFFLLWRKQRRNKRLYSWAKAWTVKTLCQIQMLRRIEEDIRSFFAIPWKRVLHFRAKEPKVGFQIMPAIPQ